MQESISGVMISAMYQVKSNNYLEFNQLALSLLILVLCQIPIMLDSVCH